MGRLWNLREKFARTRCDDNEAWTVLYITVVRSSAQFPSKAIPFICDLADQGSEMLLMFSHDASSLFEGDDARLTPLQDWPDRVTCGDVLVEVFTPRSVRLRVRLARERYVQDIAFLVVDL